MYVEYDDEADGAYIWFVNDIEEVRNDYSGEIWPEELKGEIGLLFDKQHKLLGLEIMPASKYLSQSLLQKRNIYTSPKEKQD
jgi:uncharacterized protein YuzE